MKFHLLAVTFFILTMLSAANASDLSLIQNRNEAAGFAGTMKFFVGRMARDCKPLINQDDTWMHGVVDKWMVRNSKYAIAAEAWISAMASYVANEKGIEAGRAVAGSIMNDVRTNANLKVGDLLVGSEENKKQTCTDFEGDIINGKFDITEQAPLFNQLEELVTIIK